MGHAVHMAQSHEDIIETNWQEGLRQRIKQARGSRSQQDMADLLGITQTAYSKYEGSRGTVMPVRLMPKFCKICAVSLEWLIEGDKMVKPTPEIRSKSPKRRAG